MTTITLTQVAKSIKVNPKVARRRLRSNGVISQQILAALVGSGSRWVFPATKRSMIVAAIKA